MALVQWSEDLSVGNDRLDDHHRELFLLVNQLDLAIARRDTLETTGQVLGELIRYVFYHFGEEERLMAEANYPDLETHRQHHRSMTDRVRALESAYDSDPSQVLAQEVRDMLADWLLRHIRSEDQLYRGYIS